MSDAQSVVLDIATDLLNGNHRGQHCKRFLVDDDDVGVSGGMMMMV